VLETSLIGGGCLVCRGGLDETSNSLP